MGALRRIPYKYTEEKGVFRVYELGLQLSNFLRYVPSSFCFEMIRSEPDTVFDIRTLDKKTIFEWMNLCRFDESDLIIPHCLYEQKPLYYSYQVQSVRNFQERIEKLDKWKYRERKSQTCYQHSSKPKIQLTEEIFDDENYTITTRLTPTGVQFKEWSSDLT